MLQFADILHTFDIKDKGSGKVPYLALYLQNMPNMYVLELEFNCTLFQMQYVVIF